MSGHNEEHEIERLKREIEQNEREIERNHQEIERSIRRQEKMRWVLTLLRAVIDRGEELLQNP
jgi:hypothetical protein